MAALPHYDLHLTAAQVDVLAAGLGELPLKIAGPVFEVLRRQVATQEQIAAQPDAPSLDADNNPV